jgi:hypothetical protein
MCLDSTRRYKMVFMYAETKELLDKLTAELNNNAVAARLTEKVNKSHSPPYCYCEISTGTWSRE